MHKLKKIEKGISSVAISKILVFVIIIAGFLSYGAYRGLNYYNTNKTIQKISDFFAQYQKNLDSFVTNSTKINQASDLKNLSLMPDCETKPSTFNRAKQVCALPLGEIDVNSESNEAKFYTFVYIHFTNMQKEESCKRFLAHAWEKTLPQNWFGEESYIGVISENTTGKIYFSHNEEWIREDGAELNPTEEHSKEICQLCQDSRYCSVLFAFDFNKENYRANP